jgi:hypothetical protein
MAADRQLLWDKVPYVIKQEKNGRYSTRLELVVLCRVLGCFCAAWQQQQQQQEGNS